MPITLHQQYRKNRKFGNLQFSFPPDVRRKANGEQTTFGPDPPSVHGFRPEQRPHLNGQQEFGKLFTGKNWRLQQEGEYAAYGESEGAIYTRRLLRPD